MELIRQVISLAVQVARPEAVKWVDPDREPTPVVAAVIQQLDLSRVEALVLQ
jgi:hypothetical protein